METVGKMTGLSVAFPSRKAVPVTAVPAVLLRKRSKSATRVLPQRRIPDSILTVGTRMQNARLLLWKEQMLMVL